MVVVVEVEIVDGVEVGVDVKVGILLNCPLGQFSLHMGWDVHVSLCLSITHP